MMLSQVPGSLETDLFAHQSAAAPHADLVAQR